MNDVLCWIGIGVICIIFALAGIACVIMASKYDEISDDCWKEFFGEEDVNE